MPGKKKDLVGKVVNYLQNHGGEGEAELDLDAMSKSFVCTKNGLFFALRALKRKGIIEKTVDAREYAGLVSKYRLAEQFREGESWREVYWSFRKPWAEKSPSTPASQAVEQEPGKNSDAGLNPLTAELIKIHQWASSVRAEIAPLQKRNEELEQRLRDASIEIQRLSDELEAVTKALTRHRENERIAEQRLITLRRENAVAMGTSGSKVIFDGQGFQIEKKPL